VVCPPEATPAEGLSEIRQTAAAVSPTIVVTCTWTHGQV